MNPLQNIQNWQVWLTIAAALVGIIMLMALTGKVLVKLFKRWFFIIAVILCLSSCCIYQDIQETIENPKLEQMPGGYNVDLVDVYKPSDRVRMGDVYKTK
jgi:hypothetical protein